MDKPIELAAANSFVNKARVLEKLKADSTIPEDLYRTGKYLLFLGNNKVCLNADDKLLFKKYEDIKTWEPKLDSKILLLNLIANESGSHVCLFAVDVKPFNGDSQKDVEALVQGTFVNARKCLFFLTQQESQYVTHGLGLIHFSQSFKFCSFCGGSLVEGPSSHRKQCSKCNYVQYPTLSPVGLTLIEDENHEEVLLVRQDRHPPGMYTCVAGFVEPGETLEENTRREIAEEVGVEVGRVEYCTSQHWALPVSQFTLACIATALTKQVNIDPKEIQSAKWVKADALKEAVIRTRGLKEPGDMDPEKLWAPPRNAASHNLMLIWLKRYHNFDSASSS